MIPFHLLFLVASFSAAYAALYVLFPVFFRIEATPIGPRSVLSLGLIVLALLAVLVAVARTPDPEFGNRLLHALGGGVLSLLVCWRVVHDARLAIPKFQFFVFSFLVVETLGVGNEIVEFVLANNYDLNFAPTPNDTWLDLVSNTIGALIGGVIFTPLVGGRKRGA